MRKERKEKPCNARYTFSTVDGVFYMDGKTTESCRELISRARKQREDVINVIAEDRRR